MSNEPLLRFRRAVVADAPDIHHLVESAYRGEKSRAGWTTEADFLDGQRTDEDQIRALIEDQSSAILLAEADGELLGCCYLVEHEEEVHFGMFAVRPLRQGAGIGRQLMAEAERLVRSDSPGKSMHLTVLNVRPELIAWYERRGYHLTGETEVFPYGDERFGIPKRADLVLLVMRKTLEGL